MLAYYFCNVEKLQAPPLTSKIDEICRWGYIIPPGAHVQESDGGVRETFYILTLCKTTLFYSYPDSEKHNEQTVSATIILFKVRQINFSLTATATSLTTRLTYDLT